MCDVRPLNPLLSHPMRYSTFAVSMLSIVSTYKIRDNRSLGVTVIGRMSARFQDDCFDLKCISLQGRNLRA